MNPAESNVVRGSARRGGGGPGVPSGCWGGPGSVMAGLPPIDYQVLAQTLLANNVAASGGAAGAVADGGAAPAAAAAHYNCDHMDIKRAESSMKKFLSENCVDTNATML